MKLKWDADSEDEGNGIEKRIVEISLEEISKLGLAPNICLKVGLDHNKGKGLFKFYIASAKRLEDGTPFIYLAFDKDIKKWEKGFRKQLRHELYHIYKGDIDVDLLYYPFSFKYLFWELKAEIYTLTGLKL